MDKSCLKERRLELGLTMLEIAKKVGVSEATISRWESGDIDNMRRDKIALLANALEISPLSILGIEKEKPQKSLIPSRVPLLGKIRCGVPLLDTCNWDEQVDVPQGMKADFAARAEGDSMIYAGIHSGDIILFKENCEPYNGQVVATRHVNEIEGVNLKYFIKKNGQALLRSANPEYEDIELNGSHKIIGVMSGLIREEAPSLHEYESMLAVKSDVEDRWTETIALAAAHGITPEAIQNMINMHVTMAFNLAKKKK